MVGLAADRHLGDVDPVLAEDRAHLADDARHVAVREDHQDAVEVALQSAVALLHQPRHVVAEQRAGGPDVRSPLTTSAVIIELKLADVAGPLLDQFDAALVAGAPRR